MRILELRDVTKDFQASSFRKKGLFRAVSDFSICIESATTYGLVGESGSGKSTVARIATKLINPTSGQIFFEGRDVTSLNKDELLAYRRDVQIIFQDPYNALNPRMTVRQLIVEPWEIHKLHSKSERERRAHVLIDQVGLPQNSLERKPLEFSGGQRQRIMIARALALEPKLIVADEPVSALDVLIQAQILNLLKDLQRDMDLTYLFISHDLSVVEFMSDQIGVMNKSELVEVGTKEEIYRNPKSDYTKRLLESIPSQLTALGSKDGKR